MKTSTLLSAVLLGVASLGLSAGAFADGQDPLSQAVTGTNETMKKAGQDTLDAANNVGKTTHDAVKQTGKMVDSAGQATHNAVKGMTNTKQ